MTPAYHSHSLIERGYPFSTETIEFKLQQNSPLLKKEVQDISYAVTTNNNWSNPNLEVRYIRLG